MSHVVLFGATGFLGVHIRDALVRHPGVDQVTCPGRISCDLLTDDVDAIRDLLLDLRATTVVNCTGRLDGSASELVQANTTVTAKLIDAIAACDDEAIRYIRLGSAGEYGPVPYGRAAHEADVAGPVSAYGLSHLAATRLVELAAGAGRVDGLTLRVFNPIGAGMREGNLLGRAAFLLRKALSTDAPTITMGPLTAYRDFVDARDVAAAVTAATVVPNLTDRVVNVGSGRAVSARTAVCMLAQAAAYTGEIHEKGAGSARSASVDWMLADIGRAARVLGWRPLYDLSDSVQSVWAASAGTTAASAGAAAR